MKKTSTIALLSLSWVLTLPGAIAQDEHPGEEPTVVFLKREATIGGWEVLLGDVATVEGPDLELVARLLGETLSSAPSPARSAFLDRDEIAQKLIDRGYLGRSVRLRGAPQVQVSTRAKTLHAEEIQRRGVERIQRWFSQSLNDSNLSQTEVIVEPSTTLSDLVVPSGRRGTDVVLRGNPRDMSERFANLTAHVVVDGRTIKKIPLRFELRRFQPALVATHPMRRGDAFSPDDLEIRRVEVTGIAGRMIKSPEELKGAVAGRNLAAHAPILSQDALFPALVKRGKITTVILRNGPLTITTKARAKDNGRIGDTIALDNPSSGKVIYGQVIDEGLVEIRLRPDPRSASER